MSISTRLDESGRFDIVIEAPPVNAFSLELLQQLIRALTTLPPEARVVVLRSSGRGFCGGGDVKEVQSLPGFEGILGHGRFGLDACLAIQHCPVPVIAAVHGYCIGIGVLIVGACDIILTAQDTQFVLAEADNGAATGAVLALGLLPEKRLRSAMFTCEPFTAEELHSYGSVYAVTPAGELVTTSHAVAATIGSKSPAVIRALKQAINHSTDRGIAAKYRTEMSYTYELNMTEQARAARGAFLDGSRASYVPDVTQSP